MRIGRIVVYQVDGPLHEGSYRWAGGKSVSVFDGTQVGIETESGLLGWGEVCSLGPSHCQSMRQASELELPNVARDCCEPIPRNQPP